MYTNDTNFVSSGLGAGGFGGGFSGGFGGGGLLTGVILAALLGRGGLGIGGHNNEDGFCKQLIVDAINNKTGAVEKVADLLHADVAHVKEAICDVKAKAEAHGIQLECVKDAVSAHHADFRAFQREFCDFKGDTRVALKDLEIRALIDKGDILKKVECVEDKVAKEFCQLRTEFKDQRIAELEKELCRSERNYDKRDTEINNVNFGTQITQLTNTLTALASKIG